MKYAVLFACRRLYNLARASFAIAGVIATIILAYPTVELKFNPPVAAWQIIDATREGNMLKWFIYVDKRRDCRSTIRWFGRTEVGILPLRGIWPDGFQANGSRISIRAGERGRFGPLFAVIPEPWLNAKSISIDADVVYNCGTPWALPAVPVEEAIAR